MAYRVKEIFYTLQGEGRYAGTPALFLRFVGCNLWSGQSEHRGRDAERNGAKCPHWCDTDFVGGESLDIADLMQQLCATYPGSPRELPLLVLTGGEPFLQVDWVLCNELHKTFRNATLAVETNGTVEPKKHVHDCLDWICISPKVPVDRLKLKHGGELKVVYPAYDPQDYQSIADNFEYLYVSAEAETLEVGRSLIAIDNLKHAAAWVMEHPDWRLTLQAHKFIGLA